MQLQCPCMVFQSLNVLEGSTDGPEARGSQEQVLCQANTTGAEPVQSHGLRIKEKERTKNHQESFKFQISIWLFWIQRAVFMVSHSFMNTRFKHFQGFFKAPFIYIKHLSNSHASICSVMKDLTVINISLTLNIYIQIFKSNNVWMCRFHNLDRFEQVVFKGINEIHWSQYW